MTLRHFQNEEEGAALLAVPGGSVEPLSKQCSRCEMCAGALDKCLAEGSVRASEKLLKEMETGRVLPGEYSKCLYIYIYSRCS